MVPERFREKYEAVLVQSQDRHVLADASGVRLVRSIMGQ